MIRDPDEIETMAAPTSAITPPHAQKERFATGTLLASRFRIVSILGNGGMGEVFRADDLILGQPVALKFLPESAKSNVNLLTRFYDEVRIARQISHKNVCRVYDIGEVGGQPYLSMEYIDGEDPGEPAAPHRASSRRQSHGVCEEAVRRRRRRARSGCPPP